MCRIDTVITNNEFPQLKANGVIAITSLSKRAFRIRDPRSTSNFFGYYLCLFWVRILVRLLFIQTYGNLSSGF